VGKFFRRKGFYYPKCRSDGVPRFRCRSCGRDFSFQTFRHDRGDQKPWCNEQVFLLLCSGVSLRQIGRLVKIDIHSVQGKKRKMGRTFGPLHHNLCPRLPADRTYLLDEEETYEAASIRPLTLPVLVEQENWFMVATAVGSIRRLARTGSRRRLQQEREERLHGRRPDQSRECVRKVLSELARLVPEGNLVLRSDDKATYGVLAKELFGNRLRHEVTPGTLIRRTHNPLFAVNTTLAMSRDNCGRLRRKSWLVTKKAERLQNHMLVFTIYRNYVRRRFNYDKEHQTPAQRLGLLPRNLQPAEALAWRQDWGDLSIHPMSTTGSRTVRDRIPA
jgi:hypothetical protein